eukprot:COSAG06_NODE_7612_length_2440_cov_2.434857_1_plen_51_part_00
MPLYALYATFRRAVHTTGKVPDLRPRSVDIRQVVAFLVELIPFCPVVGVC